MRTKNLRLRLNGYLFVDFEHAHSWLVQTFVTKTEYSVSLVRVRNPRPCRECGRERDPKVLAVLQTYSPKQFRRLARMPVR